MQVLFQFRAIQIVLFAGILLFFSFCTKKKQIIQTPQTPIVHSRGQSPQNQKIPVYRKWGFLGLELLETKKYLVVKQVLVNTPAQVARIKPGDQLVSINSIDLHAPRALQKYQKYLRRLGVGARVMLKIFPKNMKNDNKNRNELTVHKVLLTITYPQDKQLFTMGLQAKRNGNNFLAKHYFHELQKKYSYSPLIKKLKKSKKIENIIK